MQLVNKPERMSFTRKVMAMYANQFYMRPVVKREFLSLVERGQIVNDKQAVDFVDNNGEWLS